MNKVLVMVECAECDAVSGPVQLDVYIDKDDDGEPYAGLRTDTPDGWEYVQYVGDVCPACWLERSKLEKKP